MRFEVLLVDEYIFRTFMSSCWIDALYFYTSFFSLIIVLILRSALSDINISTPLSFIYVFKLKWVSPRYRWGFFPTAHKCWVVQLTSWEHLHLLESLMWFRLVYHFVFSVSSDFLSFCPLFSAFFWLILIFSNSLNFSVGPVAIRFATIYYVFNVCSRDYSVHT